MHEVRNAGDGMLRFAAVYAEADVVTTYCEPVQPDGSRERPVRRAHLAPVRSS